jgi:hypothetical protein
MDKSTSESIIKLLKVIVALMLRPTDNKPLSLKQQIEVLYELGLRPSEIAEILGRTGGYVNKELSVSGIRKKSKER